VSPLTSVLVKEDLAYDSTWEGSALGVLRRETSAPLLVCRGNLDTGTVGLVEEALAWLGRSESLSVLLSSTGGRVMPAYKIALLLRERYTNIRMIIPRRARSSATLLTLAADRIALGEFAELGPLDASILVQPFPPDGVLRLSASDAPYLRRIGRELFSAGLDGAISGFPGNAAAISALMGIYRTEEVVKQLAVRVLQSVREPLPPERIEELVDQLVHGYVSHEYPIMRAEAQAIGLPIERVTTGHESLLRAAERQIAQLSAERQQERAIVIGGRSDDQWNVFHAGDEK
jgi:hypothetical protein